MRLFLSYIKKNILWLAANFLCLLVMILIVGLNSIPISEWRYGVMVCLFLLLTICGVDFLRYCSKHRRLVKLQEVIKISVDALELPEDILEADYQELIRLVHENKIMDVNVMENQKTEMMEYYTMWVHQIKTPIAAMHLLLQAKEEDGQSEIAQELFRIEQYVEMALQYLRLNTDSTDYLFRRFELDDIVREAVRKYARLFIRKKISLTFEPLHTQVLTDEKWLEFVIEQVLSNAIKYTASGSVSIYMEADCTLVIEDTGIGIRAEDLPRVCEKGYTGYNGHTDKRSTGIGLYLCRRILKKLGHTIAIESEVGKGTRVLIGLDRGEGEQICE